MAKILIVTKDAVVRESMKQLLSSKAHTVVAAGGGRSGLKLFKAQRPDVTILDRDLAGLCGTELVRGIRTIDDEARIIVLAGWSDTGVEDRYRELGVHTFLPMDFSSRSFLAVVTGELVCSTRRWLNESRGLERPRECRSSRGLIPAADAA